MCCDQVDSKVSQVFTKFFKGKWSLDILGSQKDVSLTFVKTGNVLIFTRK